MRIDHDYLKTTPERSEAVDAFWRGLTDEQRSVHKRREREEADRQDENARAFGGSVATPRRWRIYSSRGAGETLGYAIGRTAGEACEVWREEAGVPDEAHRDPHRPWECVLEALPAADDEPAPVDDRQISALAAEARAAGDDLQFILCTIALEGALGSQDGFEERFGGGGWRLSAAEIRRVSALTQEQARSECEAVIRENSGRRA